MKQIINGRLYNTDTAKGLATYEPNYYTNDFNWYSEKLYQKTNGDFFVRYERNCLGGCSEVLTNYRHYMTERNPVIIPISENDARKWAEENLDADKYISIFGEPEE